MCVAFCPLRVLMLILATSVLSCLHANILLWNFTKLCMTETNSPGVDENQNSTQDDRIVVYNRYQRSIFNSSLDRPFEQANFTYYSSTLSTTAAADYTNKSSTIQTYYTTTTTSEKISDINDQLNLSIPLSSDMEKVENDSVTNEGNAVTVSKSAEMYKRLEWSEETQGLVFSAFAWGAVVAAIPCSFATQRFGSRLVLVTVGSVSALATVFSPFAAYKGAAYFIVCRILQGLGFAAIMPAAAAVTANWARLSENGIFMGLLISCVQISAIIAMPISGVFCSNENIGWPAVYYFHGGASLLALVTFWFLYRDNPRKHFGSPDMSWTKFLREKAA